jgi:hypothetical protein
MKTFALFLLLAEIPLLAQQPDGKTLLNRIDRNMSSENRIFTSKMIIHGSRNVRTVESKSWTAGEKKSFTEYLFPARDQGTKMLKLGDQLWIYTRKWLTRCENYGSIRYGIFPSGRNCMPKAEVCSSAPSYRI